VVASFGAAARPAHKRRSVTRQFLVASMSRATHAGHCCETQVPTATTSTTDLLHTGQILPQNWPFFGRQRWHRGCSIEGCRAATAARRAAPVFRWSIRPTTHYPAWLQGESQDTPCPAISLQFPVPSYQLPAHEVNLSLVSSVHHFTLRHTSHHRFQTGSWELRASSAASVRQGFLQDAGVGGARTRQ
jgi:hypothetical protein